MSDKDFGGSDELSLPKATVSKIITEILPQTAPPTTQPPTFSREARDLLITCSMEFLRMLSSEANEHSEKEAKKTIAVEHIASALTELGFSTYVNEVVESAGEFKEIQKTRERRVNKMEESGYTAEQLMAMQEEMFKSAREKYQEGGSGSTGGPA